MAPIAQRREHLHEVHAMAADLKGKKVAALVDHGFEQSELLEPKKALENAGARVDVVSPQQNEVKGWQHTDWGQNRPGRSCARPGARIRLRRAAPPGRRDESRSSPQQRAGGGVRA